MNKNKAAIYTDYGIAFRPDTFAWNHPYVMSCFMTLVSIVGIPVVSIWETIKFFFRCVTVGCSEIADIWRASFQFVKYKDCPEQYVIDQQKKASM